MDRNVAPFQTLIFLVHDNPPLALIAVSLSFQERDARSVFSFHTLNRIDCLVIDRAAVRSMSWQRPLQGFSFKLQANPLDAWRKYSPMMIPLGCHRTTEGQYRSYATIFAIKLHKVSIVSIVPRSRMEQRKALPA